MRELSVSELEHLEEGSFLLIDTRSEDSVRYRIGGYKMFFIFLLTKGFVCDINISTR